MRVYSTPGLSLMEQEIVSREVAVFGRVTEFITGPPAEYDELPEGIVDFEEGIMDAEEDDFGVEELDFE